MRVPLTESQTEFEGSLDILAKLLSDGLNDKEIQRRLESRIKDEKSIAKFDIVQPVAQQLGQDIEAALELRLRFP